MGREWHDKSNKTSIDDDARTMCGKTVMRNEQRQEKEEDEGEINLDDSFRSSRSVDEELYHRNEKRFSVVMQIPLFDA